MVSAPGAFRTLMVNNKRNGKMRRLQYTSLKSCIYSDSAPSCDDSHGIFHAMPKNKGSGTFSFRHFPLSDEFICSWYILHPTHKKCNLYPRFYIRKWYHWHLGMSTCFRRRTVKAAERPAGTKGRPMYADGNRNFAKFGGYRENVIALLSARFYNGKWKKPGKESHCAYDQ